VTRDLRDLATPRDLRCAPGKRVTRLREARCSPFPLGVESREALFGGGKGFFFFAKRKTDL
jgi:hypothetical protein